MAMTLTTYGVVYKPKELREDGVLCDVKGAIIRTHTGTYGIGDIARNVVVPFRKVNDKLSDDDKRLLEWAGRMARKHQWAEKVRSKPEFKDIENMVQMEFYVHRRALNRHNRKLVQQAASIEEPGAKAVTKK